MNVEDRLDELDERRTDIARELRAIYSSTDEAGHESFDSEAWLAAELQAIEDEQMRLCDVITVSGGIRYI